MKLDFARGGRVVRSLAGRLLGTAFVVLCAATAAQAGSDRFEGVRAYIREQMIEQSIPSVAVAVVEDGEIVWEQGFGWADRERRITADAHTPYSIASISKPLTATGLMVLAEAGKVDLDKPANDYLGPAKLTARVGDADAATVRMVAAHRSGLPLHYQFFYADEPYRPPSRDETILRYGNLVTPPGEAQQYSNLGYGVLDYIIERVPGESYADFMRRHVFVPLGMMRSSVGIGPGLEPYVAARYGGDGAPLPFYEFDHDGGSAIYTSVHDLARFALFHMKAPLADQKAILSEAAIDEMHRPFFPVSPDEDSDAFYELGFSDSMQHGIRVFGHSGGMGGVATLLRIFPDQNAAIIVFTNFSDGLPRRVADRIAAVLFPGWPVESDEPSEDAEPAPFDPPAEMVGTWRGTLSTYKGDLPVELVVERGGEVRARFGEQLWTLVNGPQIEAGVFSGELAARIGTPDTERYRYTVALTLRRRGTHLTGVASAVTDAKPTERLRNALSHWLTLEKGADEE